MQHKLIVSILTKALKLGRQTIRRRYREVTIVCVLIEHIEQIFYFELVLYYVSHEKRNVRATA